MERKESKEVGSGVCGAMGNNLEKRVSNGFPTKGARNAENAYLV